MVVMMMMMMMEEKEKKEEEVEEEKEKEEKKEKKEKNEEENEKGRWSRSRRRLTNCGSATSLLSGRRQKSFPYSSPINPAQIPVPIGLSACLARLESSSNVSWQLDCPPLSPNTVCSPTPNSVSGKNTPPLPN
jgi:hypothetical protein